MHRLFTISLRLLCYPPLVFLTVAYGAMTTLDLTSSCNDLLYGSPRCGSEFARELAEWSLSIILLSILTGLPALLATGGAILALIDIRRAWSAS